MTMISGKDWDEHLPGWNDPKPTTPEYTGIGYTLEQYSSYISIPTKWLLEESK